MGILQEPLREPCNHRYITGIACSLCNHENIVGKKNRIYQVWQINRKRKKSTCSLTLQWFDTISACARPAELLFPSIRFLHIANIISYSFLLLNHLFAVLLHLFCGLFAAFCVLFYIDSVSLLFAWFHCCPPCSPAAPPYIKVRPDQGFYSKLWHTIVIISLIS